jgi:ribosomal-protein-alanine N-acetyltransferase
LITPTISTNRLTLRPLTKATSRNIAWLRDRDVVRYSQQRHRDHTLSSQVRYINSFVGRSHLWGIYLAESGNHIGNISAANDEPNNVSDIGIMIGETAFWGKGYAREAWTAACGWLLDKDYGGVRKLEAGCSRNNVAMMKIIQGSGFKQEGELLNHLLIDNAPVSAVLFGRMR